MNATAAHDVPATPLASHVWLEIPRLTARLLWRHWPVLLFWFFAQRLSYDLLMEAALRLASVSVLLAYAALALLIVTQLAGAIAMFLALRPSLPMLAGRDALPDTTSDKPWVNALALALLPFFAYYATWGLLEGLKREFRLGYIFWVPSADYEPLERILEIKGLWLALLLAWAVRYIAKRRVAARSGHLFWNILATACEAYWVFVGVVAISQGIAALKGWWHERVVYVAVSDWWQNPFALGQWLPPIKRVVVPGWDFVTTAAGGLVLPLVWLAITAIVYGIDLRRAQRIDAADESLGVAATRFQKAPYLVRHVAGKASAGWTSKGVPVVNSLRLVLRAGLPALLTLCVGWHLLAFLDAVSWRALIELVGPVDPRRAEITTNVIATIFSDPLGFRPSLFTQLISTALLAATFDRAIAHLPRAAVPPLDSTAR